MNIDGPDLEDRYRRVLRLLPAYYRDQAEPTAPGPGHIAPDAERTRR